MGLKKEHFHQLKAATWVLMVLRGPRGLFWLEKNLQGSTHCVHSFMKSRKNQKWYHLERNGSWVENHAALPYTNSNE